MTAVVPPTHTVVVRWRESGRIARTHRFTDAAGAYEYAAAVEVANDRWTAEVQPVQRPAIQDQLRKAA